MEVFDRTSTYVVIYKLGLEKDALQLQSSSSTTNKATSTVVNRQLREPKSPQSEEDHEAKEEDPEAKEADGQAAVQEKIQPEVG